MRTLSATLLSLVITAAHALAAGEVSDGEGLGLMAMFFIGFGVLIVMFQFIPGALLLVGMLKGIFSSAGNKAHEAIGSK